LRKETTEAIDEVQTQAERASLNAPNCP